jgi:hypothetical protein
MGYEIIRSFLERKREVLRLSGGFAVVRNDDSAGRLALRPFPRS